MARPVAQKDRPGPKSTLVEQLEPSADVVRQSSLATTDENRNDRQLQLVDQARGDRLTGELSYGICMPEMALATTSRWISEVPSKIV